MKFSLPILLALSILSACGLKDAQHADQQAVKTLISQNKSEIEACYDQAIRRSPHLPGGHMTVRADQHIDGSLHSAQLLHGFAGSNEVFDCVANKVNSWSTLPPKTWGPVDLSFEFKNRGQGQASVEKDFGSVMKAHKQEIGRCYEKEAEKNPKVSRGEIQFRFTRTKDGRVRDVEKLKGFPGSNEVFECMIPIVEGFRLGETPGEAKMVWSQKFDKARGTAVRDSKGNWH